MELIDKKRCVIVAAGKINSPDILKKNIYYDDYIIAADAGYTVLKAAGITPNLIVGDFDSSDTPEEDIQTEMLSPIKDVTDTEYAVGRAVESGFENILIIGGLGGRIDHSYANIALIARYKQSGVNITLIDDKHTVFVLKDEQKSFVKKNEYVSVFAFAGDANVTLDGFYYEQENFNITAFDSIGVSNEVSDDTARITVNSGTVLVIEASKS